MRWNKCSTWKRSLAVIIALCGLTPQSAMSQNGYGFSELRPSAAGQPATTLQEVIESPTQPRMSLGLLGSNPALVTVVEQALYEQGLDPQMTLQPVAPTTNPPGVESQDYVFSFRGVPLCGARIRAFRGDDGLPLILGQAPLGMIQQPEANTWPNIEAARATALRDIRASLGYAVRFASETQCYHKIDVLLIPAWQMSIAVGIGIIDVLADANDTYDIQRRYFSIDGTAVTYPRDPFQGDDFESYPLLDLEPSTDKLQNSFFVTTYDDLGASGISRASPTDAATRTYDYSGQVFTPVAGPNPDLARDHFAEVSAFSNLNRILSFFQGLGFNAPFSQPMPVIMNYGNSPSTPDININNAAYLIDETTGRPKIVIGDGDGVNLKYLPLSFDVVAHEFSHHVIFRALKTTVGTSVLIHEGLADFFTMMMTEDPCLAPSICGSVCFIPTCLRTADNDFYVGGNVGSKSWSNTQYHLQSQVISGMLWSLYQDGRVPKADLTTLVYNAIDYLPTASSFKQMIEAMVMADKVKLDGQYGCEVVVAAEERKLVGEGEVACTGDKAGIVSDKEVADGQTDGETVSKRSSTSSRKDDGPFGFASCGTLFASGSYAHSASSWFAWALWLLPALVSCHRKRRR